MVVAPPETACLSCLVLSLWAYWTDAYLGLFDATHIQTNMDSYESATTLSGLHYSSILIYQFCFSKAWGFEKVFAFISKHSRSVSIQITVSVSIWKPWALIGHVPVTWFVQVNLAGKTTVWNYLAYYSLLLMLQAQKPNYKCCGPYCLCRLLLFKSALCFV